MNFLIMPQVGVKSSEIIVFVIQAAQHAYAYFHAGAFKHIYAGYNRIIENQFRSQAGKIA